MKTEGVGGGGGVEEGGCMHIFGKVFCFLIYDRKQLLIVSEPLKHIQMFVVGYIAKVL